MFAGQVTPEFSRADADTSTTHLSQSGLFDIVREVKAQMPPKAAVVIASQNYLFCCDDLGLCLFLFLFLFSDIFETALS